MLSAIVLAAGESTRMGPDNKLLLPFRGRPLIAHSVRTVVLSDVDEVIVVLGHEADRVRDALATYDVAFAYNPRYRDGMTTSIQAGVRATSAQTDGFMICLSDLPMIEPADLNQVTAAFREVARHAPRPIIRPVYQTQPGHPVIFSTHYKTALLAHQDLRGCQAIVKQNRDSVIDIEMTTNHVLHDVDTPDAYQCLHRHDGDP